MGEGNDDGDEHGFLVIDQKYLDKIIEEERNHLINQLKIEPSLLTTQI